MRRSVGMKCSAVAILAAIACQAASAAAVDPYTRFKWAISHELAVMKATPQAIPAAVKPGTDVPRLKLDTLYTLTLADQSAVTFVTGPEKSGKAAAATGVVRFRTAKAGRYRVSITSGHWITSSTVKRF
jgi:hypothetical protein